MIMHAIDRSAELVIEHIDAWEILDCRGLPTLRVEVRLDDGSVGRADVPAGRSTGVNEATELRDGGSRFCGFGVRGAADVVRGLICDTLVGKRFGSHREIDSALITLDGTARKERLGGNATSGVSLAAARAAAVSQGVPFYRWLDSKGHVLPVPQVNLINGGRHASNDLDFQEFIIVPSGVSSFMEAMELSTEVNLALGRILLKRFGKVALNRGDEGGYAPPMSDPHEALTYLREAVAAAGFEGVCHYGLDCAASQFYDSENDAYRVNGSDYDRDGMITMYQRLVEDFGVVSIEDPFHEEDFQGFAQLRSAVNAQIVGDDLFVTNPRRVEQGIAAGAANALLWKFNQIGTLSEALEAAAIAIRNDYLVVVSERSGETEDPLIADIAVGLSAGQIKTGAPVRGERTSKYNRLLEIERELGDEAKYAGEDFMRRLDVAG
jgi:enolase